MANSTTIRPFSRLIDRAATPFWVVGPDGRLVFLSAAVGDWLTIEPESLVGRLCVAGTSISEDPLDYLAASLAAPSGFLSSGTASLLVQPTFPGARSRRIAPRDTRFVRIGQGAEAITLAVAGDFNDQAVDPVIDGAVLLRQQLDSWRRHHEAFATSVLIGTSRAARRIDRQVRLAGSVRSDLMILSPSGCFQESVATTVHQKAAPGEPVVMIDGSLMDAELLDASLGVVLNHLADSDRTTATAIVKAIDETPPDAQYRLAEHLQQFNHRLRLIAIADRYPQQAVDDPGNAKTDDAVGSDEPSPVGIINSLADRLCGLRIRLCPLAERIEDLPVIATSLLDRRRASGDGSADRMARATLDALVIYPWPDNFRELDQAIRHATRHCRGEVIGLEDLPLAIRSYRPNQSVPVDQQEINLDQAVRGFESELIHRTLRAADGNRAEAARRLSISRARLLRKLELFDGGANP
jgi:hypothetical protein